MGMLNALTYGEPAGGHAPDRVKMLAAKAGLELTDEQAREISSRAFGEATRVERCREIYDSPFLVPDPRGEWYLRCHDCDGGGGVTIEPPTGGGRNDHA